MAVAKVEVQLAYALDRDGAKVHVGALDSKRRGERAPFRCSSCGDALIPHLGQQRARHFAHKPGTRCALASPETALHFNAKERLLELCRAAFTGELSVRMHPRCPKCLRPGTLDLAAQGDAANAEARMGTLVPDVLVRRAGSPSLAFEVRVTHAVSDAKAVKLAAVGIPVIEIDARTEWLSETPEGSATIAVARAFNVVACGSCQSADLRARDRTLGGELAEIAELETYRARGLMGARPGPAASERPAIRDSERAALEAHFGCKQCGGRALVWSPMMVRHACPGGPSRAVAWRGYDGAFVTTDWWARG
jgi:hypothetical protein